MNALSEQLLEAVDILTTRKIESLQIDKSISCIVEELVDEDKNEYKVKYNGTSINAIAPTGISYAKGAIVQVKMVDDGINIIEALIDQVEGKLAYNPIMEKFSSNLLKDINEEEYRLDKNSNFIITQEFTPEQQDYFKRNTSLLLAMTIRTAFTDKITSGNYGAKVTLDAADGLTDHKYNFDIASFTGSVYNFSLESEQSILLNFVSGEYNSITIELFSDIQEPNYVYISNLGVYFTSAHDSASLYNINIESETNAEEAHLTASLNYDGEVYKPRTLAWSWYEYDLVNGPAVGAENYDKFMGEHWKKIDGEEKETYSIDLTEGDWLQKKIKAKALINGQKEYKSQEVNISNPNFNYTFDIKASSVATDPTLELEVKDKENNIQESHSYIANWFFDENPSIKVDKVNSWQIPQDIFRKYKSREITVDIYSYELEDEKIILKNYITTLHYSLSVDLQAGVILLPVKGVDWFQYSGQGILLSDTNQFSLTVDVEEDGPVSEIEWYFDNKLAVSYISDETVFLPSNTMITSIDELKDNTVTFSIDKKYDYTKTNNTFSFSYKRDEQIYTQSHELKFLLIGQTGTNGTGWYGGIEDTDEAGVYQLEVYKNGIDMLGSVTPTVEYVNCSGEISNNKITLSEKIEGSNPYIKVKVTTNDNGSVFYIFHPVSYIEIITNEGITREPALLPSNNLPKTVMYDTNGVNPPFLSKQIDIKEESYSIATDGTRLFSISNKTIDGSTVYYIDLTEDLKDVDSFVQEYQINVVKDEETTIYKSPIIFYLNRYGNNTINDWDGQSIQMNENDSILAPTIVAGVKNDDKTFSGVVMGKDTQQNLTGIYGYKEGEKTFALTEEGDAIFRGTLEAASGDFTGKVIAGEGRIGGWNISDSYIDTRPDVTSQNYRLYLAGRKIDANGQEDWDTSYHIRANDGAGNMVFSVNRDGQLYAKNAKIEGDITAYGFIAQSAANSKMKATMEATALNLYTDSKEKPKMSLQIRNDRARIILGQGAWSDGSTAARFFLDKTAKGTDLIYYNDNNKFSKIEFTGTGIWIHGEDGTGNITLTSNNGNLQGTWKLNGSAAITSDINKKNSIITLPEEYSVLFDNLHPVTYKYNDGTSDRLHTGFIAQEVAEALAAAGIPTKDFAGLVISDPDTEDESWYLRYEEFIALNTQQIQKMKTHISELEERIAHLENLLQANSN